MQDERKPYFLIQFKLESTAAEILFCGKANLKGGQAVSDPVIAKDLFLQHCFAPITAAFFLENNIASSKGGDVKY